MTYIYKSLLIVSTLLTFSCFLSSCRGSAGKKAATEAIELIEKKAASKAASAAEREVVQAERSATKSRAYRPRHYSSDDNAYSPQVFQVQCNQCGGAGFVYIVDYYRNIQYDIYGYPIVDQCPSCGGSGSILISE